MRFSMLALAVVALDQVTKAWVSASIAPGETRTVIPGFLHIAHVYNTGAAFGLFASRQLLLSAVAAALLAYAWIKRRDISRQPTAVRLGIALGLAGATGNTIDRVWRGAVLDFLSVPLIPVFNVADVAIVAGVAVLVVAVLFKRDEPFETEDEQAETARVSGAGAPEGGFAGQDEKG